MIFFKKEDYRIAYQKAILIRKVKPKLPIVLVVVNSADESQSDISEMEFQRDLAQLKPIKAQLQELALDSIHWDGLGTEPEKNRGSFFRNLSEIAMRDHPSMIKC